MPKPANFKLTQYLELASEGSERLPEQIGFSDNPIEVLDIAAHSILQGAISLIRKERHHAAAAGGTLHCLTAAVHPQSVAHTIAMNGAGWYVVNRTRASQPRREANTCVFGNGR